MATTLDRLRSRAGFEPGARIGWTDPGGVDRAGAIISRDDAALLVKWDDGLQKRIGWDSEDLRVTDPAEETALAEVLSAFEREELEQCEGIIERVFNTFVEAGQALFRIREKRLYRESHGTFEIYCQERWDFGRRRANQLIEAAAVVTALGTIVPKLPENEGQARALVAVPAEQRPEVWQEAVETAPNGKVTAAHIQQVAERVAPSAAQPELPAPAEAFTEEPLAPEEQQRLAECKAVIDAGHETAFEVLEAAEEIAAQTGETVGEVIARVGTQTTAEEPESEQPATSPVRPKTKPPRYQSIESLEEAEKREQYERFCGLTKSFADGLHQILNTVDPENPGRLLEIWKREANPHSSDVPYWYDTLWSPDAMRKVANRIYAVASLVEERGLRL